MGQWWSVLRSLHGRVHSGLLRLPLGAGAHVNESTTAAGPGTLPHSPLPSWNMAAEAESPWIVSLLKRLHEKGHCSCCHSRVRLSAVWSTASPLCEPSAIRPLFSLPCLPSLSCSVLDPAFAILNSFPPICCHQSWRGCTPHRALASLKSPVLIATLFGNVDRSLCPWQNTYWPCNMMQNSRDKFVMKT